MSVWRTPISAHLTLTVLMLTVVTPVPVMKASPEMDSFVVVSLTDHQRASTYAVEACFVIILLVGIVLSCVTS